MSADEFLTIEQVAEMFHVTVEHLYNQRRQGSGPLSFRIGKRILYRRGDIDAYIASAREATLRGEGQ